MAAVIDRAASGGANVGADGFMRSRVVERVYSLPDMVSSSSGNPSGNWMGGPWEDREVGGRREAGET